MTETPRRRSDSPAIREAQRSAARTGSEATGNDESGSMEQSPGHDEVATTPNLDLDKTRRRRRFWLIYSLAAVVALVLAGTVTVSGPQRLLSLGAVLLGVLGMVVVRPFQRRATATPGAAEKVTWVPVLAGPASVLISSFIRSAGSQRGGFGALVATGLAALALVVPLMLAVDAWVCLRRTRKLADQTDTPPLIEPPSPRP